MKRWIVLIVSVIGLTAGAAFFAQNTTNTELEPYGHVAADPSGPQPRVEIKGPLVHEFGQMSQFRKSSHIWEIKNVGDKDLELWLEGSTCSCTIAKLATPPGASEKEKPHVRVKPNDITPIELEWDTKEFSAEYKKSATIGTNDPRRPSFALEVHGVVYPPLIVYPPEMITVNGISNEETTPARRAVFSLDMPNMKIVKITSGRPDIITAKQSPLTDDDRKHLNVPAGGYRIDIEIKPGLPVGRFADTLVVETDHPLQKETKISIQGYANGPIGVVPQKIVMTGVSGVTGATQSVSMLVRGGKPTKFEIIQKPDDRLGVEIVPFEDQKGRYRLTVTVPPGTPAAHIDKDIILKTDHPRASEIKIPTSIIITDGSSN